MKISFVIIGKSILLFVAVCYLLNTSCSRKLYPGPAAYDIENHPEKRMLVNFMNGGFEKRLNPHNSNAEDILLTAREYLGVRHCMGGTTKECMDCSGLLVAVFARHGIDLPHSSEEQARYGTVMFGTDNLTKGDLVFFIKSYKTDRFITHSGIYMGNNKFIHTSSSRGVTITSLHDPWWRDKFIFATRVFE
jgi:murein DD-endopeptidase / murein LD-carboxypeptidase